jgi:hypothetical protein
MSETALSQGAMKTRSEELFEQYLDLNGFKGRYTYEPSIAGKSKKPDYCLDYNGQKCFFEVKELRKKQDEPPEGIAAWIDPYSGLREEINEARKKFREFKDYSCSLVVFNIDDRQARTDPRTILGVMLGNLGVSWEIDVTKGRTVRGTERNVFLDGGKMIDNKGRLQNTTISAIVVLDEFRDDSEIQKAIRDEVKKQGKPLTLVEKVEINMRVVKNHHSSRTPRVIIVENPYARIAFPEDLFVGPFDEHWRWTMENRKIERVFAGDKLKELEILKSQTQGNSND